MGEGRAADAPQADCRQWAAGASAAVAAGARGRAGEGAGAAPLRDRDARTAQDTSRATDPGRSRPSTSLRTLREVSHRCCVDAYVAFPECVVATATACGEQDRVEEATESTRESQRAPGEVGEQLAQTPLFHFRVTVQYSDAEWAVVAEW